MRVWQPIVRPDEISGLAVRSSGTAADEDVEHFGTGILHHADHIGARHVGFDRPLMAFHPEHSVLLAVGPDHVDADRIAGMGLNQRRRRILRLIHDTGLEDLAQRAALLFTILVRFGTVVDRRHTGDVLHIGHERRSDDVVLVLEEQCDIAIVPLADVLRHTGVNDDIGSPGILLREIRAGDWITVLRSLRPDDDRAVQPVTWIDDDIAAVPHQRRRFLICRMRVVGIVPAFAGSDRLIAAIVADVQALTVFWIEG